MTQAPNSAQATGQRVVMTGFLALCPSFILLAFSNISKIDRRSIFAKKRVTIMNHLQDNLPTAEEALLARSCSQGLSAIIDTKSEAQEFTLEDREGVAHKVAIPVSALRLFVELLTELGEGNMVKLVPVHAELTTQEAADLLNVSRPTLIKLLDEEAIPYHRAGNRRKILFSDLQAYKKRIEKARLATLEELSALDQELGMGYE
jgi:excisionase family DNA binding protein